MTALEMTYFRTDIDYKLPRYFSQARHKRTWQLYSPAQVLGHLDDDVIISIDGEDDFNQQFSLFA